MINGDMCRACAFFNYDEAFESLNPDRACLLVPQALVLAYSLIDKHRQAVDIEVLCKLNPEGSDKLRTCFGWRLNQPELILTNSGAYWHGIAINETELQSIRHLAALAGGRSSPTVDQPSAGMPNQRLCESDQASGLLNSLF